MLQLAPQSRIFLAVQPVDFRKGIDGLAALCRTLLHENPLGGTVYVFRNRTGTTLKLLAYDGERFPSLTRITMYSGRPRRLWARPAPLHHNVLVAW